MAAPSMCGGIAHVVSVLILAYNCILNEEILADADDNVNHLCPLLRRLDNVNAFSCLTRQQCRGSVSKACFWRSPLFEGVLLAVAII